jgi:hypothetical protein
VTIQTYNITSTVGVSVRSIVNRVTERRTVQEHPTAVFYIVDLLRFAVVWEDGQWVATEPVTGMFGEGDSHQEAVRDLLVSLQELRAELEGHSGRLSDHLEQKLAFLKTALSREVQGT